MNQPPPDNALNFPGRPHLIFIPRATPPLSRSSGSRLAEPSRRPAPRSVPIRRRTGPPPHPVDGSLGHEGADLFSTPGQAAGFREAQKAALQEENTEGKQINTPSQHGGSSAAAAAASCLLFCKVQFKNVDWGLQAGAVPPQTAASLRVKPRNSSM